MKTTTLLFAALLASACSGEPRRAVDTPREVTRVEGERCRDAGTVVKRAAGSSQQSVNTNKAMRMALDAVLDAGGNAYRVLDVDTAGQGTRVVLHAYACD